MMIHNPQVLKKSSVKALKTAKFRKLKTEIYFHWLKDMKLEFLQSFLEFFEFFELL